MLNIAHRGASGYAPENTRPAFDLAIDMGADMIETDVQLTRDGHLVLIHDESVERVSDGQGPVGDYTLAELQALDFGSWFDPRFAEQRIVTLDAFLAEYLPRIPAALEIKDARAAVPLVEAVRATGSAARVHVTSFMWPALVDAKDRYPELTYGYLGRVLDADIIARSVARGFTQVCPHVDVLTAASVEAAHAAGLVVRAWGLSDRSQIERLRASGADGSTCNWPDWLQHA